MMETTLNAYLFFDGECREAMAFYRKIFGGELHMQTFGEVDQSCPAAKRDSIMHASLMGGEVTLLGSDNADSHPLRTGKISLALAGNAEEKLRKMFAGLSEGGKVMIPLAKQVWGDEFGVLTDKFGVDWMVNIANGNGREG